MGKFNTTLKEKQKPDSVNMSGGEAYTRDSFEAEVSTLVLNSMLNGDMYYESEKDRVLRIENAVIQNPDKAEFLAKAMVFARNDGNLRSVTHLIGVLLAETAKGTNFLKNALVKTIIRPDDCTEMVSLWNSRHPKVMIPNSLRRAIKISLEGKFDAYQLKKYFGKSNVVKVSDLIKLARPTPKDENQALIFKQAIEGTLPNISTAQTVNAGSTGENRVENYRAMLKENKLGYMALLKNLVNILEASTDDEIVDLLCSALENEKAVLKSRVLPFRFTQAYDMVEQMSIDKLKSKRILKSVEQGFIYSARNIKIVNENQSVAILLDESGSMGTNYSNSKVIPFTIGKTLMASMLTGLDKTKTLGYLWADKSREVSIDVSPMTFIKNTRTQGGGTYLNLAIDDIIKTKTSVDVMVILTDMQQNGAYGFRDSINRYKAINPNVKIVFWNLAGYTGGTPLKLSNDVLEVSGFSDKLLELIPLMLEDKNALINRINSIKL